WLQSDSGTNHRPQSASPHRVPRVLELRTHDGRLAHSGQLRLKPPRGAIAETGLHIHIGSRGYLASRHLPADNESWFLPLQSQNQIQIAGSTHQSLASTREVCSWP